MALLHIPISDIDERQLNWLIASKVSETRDIEYKRDLYGSSDGDHAEWLADASSFANTSGGDIIIGIEAKNGVPLQIAPFLVDIDGEILKLEQIARSSLQPRLSALHFKPIPITGGGHVLLIRVPRSYNPPHRIVRQGKGQNRFWARSSAGKFEPNVDELRLMFTLAPQLTERMRDFRFNRIAKIAAEEAPVQLLHRCRLIMHIVPFSSLDPGSLISLASIEENPHVLPPSGQTRRSTYASTLMAFCCLQMLKGVQSHVPTRKFIAQAAWRQSTHQHPPLLSRKRDGTFDQLR